MLFLEQASCGGGCADYRLGRILSSAPMNPIAVTVFDQDLRVLAVFGVCPVLTVCLLWIIWKLSRDLKALRRREGRGMRSEGDLSHGLDFLRAITEGTSDAIFAKDRHGRYIMANPAAAKLVGKTPEEVIGSTTADLFCAATTPRVVADDRRVMETGETRTVENTSTGKNGVTRVYSTTKGPLLDGAGAVIGVFGVARDITQAKRDEHKLRESEERFRTIFEQAPLGISEGEIASGRLISANRRYADILGYNIDELRKLTFRDYTHPEDLQKDLVQFQRLAAGEIRTYTMEKRFIRKDGEIIWVNLTVSALPSLGESPPTCIAVLDDITERKEAEEALNAQALRYKTLMETSMESIYVLDRKGNLKEANAAFLRRRGYTTDDVGHLNVFDWDASSPEQVKARFSGFLEGGAGTFETRHRCRDGSVFDVEVGATGVRIGADNSCFV
jgi:PAS domain S-box-containing protein